MKTALLFSILTLSMLQVSNASITGAFVKTLKKTFKVKPNISIEQFAKGKIKESNMHLLQIRAISSGGDQSILTKLDDKIVEADFRFLDIEELLEESPRVKGSVAHQLTDELNQLNVLIAHNHAVMKMGNNDKINHKNIEDHISILKKSLNLQQQLQGYTSSTLFAKGRRSLASAYMDIKNLKAMYSFNE
jgi:hypothetical protein